MADPTPPGPFKVKTEFAGAPDDGTIGLYAKNTFVGQDLGKWETSEFIEWDEDQTTPDGAFGISEHRKSSWLDATVKPNEVRADAHLLHIGAIRFHKLRKDAHNKCVYTQVFRKRLKGDMTIGDLIQQSGFTITHTISWQQDGWWYYTSKVGHQVLAASGGEGAARYPAQGWQRIVLH